MPLTYISSSQTMVTAWDKGEVEKAGLPKIDVLGSRVLTALRIACNLLTGGDNDAARAYYRDLPMNDKAAIRRCATGNTVGLFQLGGWTNRKVCEQMAPTKVADLVAVQALARPAPMDSGFTRSFMRRRDKVEKVPEQHEDIAAETKDTYGLAIYQEQLVGVLRRLGLDAMRLTRLLKAVKASGKQHAEAAAKVMEEELEPLKALARGRGWSEADVVWLESCLRDYGAGYSFGKAHSVQYGTTGYRTAYLAEHEPLAYWTGMLTAYDGVKDPKTKEVVNLKFKRQARKDDVRVLMPHVNRSEATFAADPETYAIREGLVSIPGLGPAAAEEITANRPYESVQDFVRRTGTKVTGGKDAAFMDQATFTEWSTAKKPNAAGEMVWAASAHVAALSRVGAFDGLPYGEPMRKAKGRIRKCKDCKVTFPTPLEYEDHVEEAHGDEVAAVAGG
jgi:DNA polymerase-3 subunit alpha